MLGYKEVTCKVLCSRLDTAGYFHTLHISPVTGFPLYIVQRGGQASLQPVVGAGEATRHNATVRSTAGHVSSGTALK